MNNVGLDWVGLEGGVTLRHVHYIYSYVGVTVADDIFCSMYTISSHTGFVAKLR